MRRPCLEACRVVDESSCRGVRQRPVRLLGRKLQVWRACWLPAARSLLVPAVSTQAPPATDKPEPSEDSWPLAARNLPGPRACTKRWYRTNLSIARSPLTEKEDVQFSHVHTLNEPARTDNSKTVQTCGHRSRRSPAERRTPAHQTFFPLGPRTSYPQVLNYLLSGPARGRPTHLPELRKSLHSKVVLRQTSARQRKTLCLGGLKNGTQTHFQGSLHLVPSSVPIRDPTAYATANASTDRTNRKATRPLRLGGHESTVPTQVPTAYTTASACTDGHAESAATTTLPATYSHYQSLRSATSNDSRKPDNTFASAVEIRREQHASRILGQSRQRAPVRW